MWSVRMVGACLCLRGDTGQGKEAAGLIDVMSTMGLTPTCRTYKELVTAMSGGPVRFRKVALVRVPLFPRSAGKCIALRVLTVCSVCACVCICVLYLLKQKGDDASHVSTAVAAPLPSRRERHGQRGIRCDFVCCWWFFGCNSGRA